MGILFGCFPFIGVVFVIYNEPDRGYRAAETTVYFSLMAVTFGNDLLESVTRFGRLVT